MIATAGFAVAAGLAVVGDGAVQRLREDASRRGLAGASRPGEQVGVADAPVATALRSARVTCSWPRSSAKRWGRKRR